MQGINLQSVESFISSSRLKNYTVLSNGNKSLQPLIGGYLWNKQLAGAVLPILQCLEVTLRNAIHIEAAKHFNASDWYDALTKKIGDELFVSVANNPSHNFYRNGISTGSRKGKKIWTSHHENMIAEAKKKLKKAEKKLSSDAVVSELMFGFWCGLFTSNYLDIHTNNKLWPHLEEKVFVNLPPSDRRHSVVFHKLDELKVLRNRVSHHEPIWKHSSVTDIASAILYLKTLIYDAISLIGGVSTERKDLLLSSNVMMHFYSLCNENTLNQYINGQRN